MSAKKTFYLIGNPVEHSVSPQMQHAAFKELELDYEYIARKVANEEDLDDTVDEFRSKNIAGFNVTVPFKENIIGLLDEVDGIAKKIGAVNTVVNKKGKLIGYNTDHKGFYDSIKLDAGIDIKDKKTVVIGSGGASKAVCFALCHGGVSELTIYDVDGIKTEDLEAVLKHNFKIPIKGIFNKNDLGISVKEAGILVNATPIGMFPKIDESPVDEEILHDRLFVYDLIYNPHETLLVSAAKSKGADGMTGLGMLVRQGAAAFELFTGKKAPIEVMRKAAEEALGI